MVGVPKSLPWAKLADTPELLVRAGSLIAREALRLPAASPVLAEGARAQPPSVQQEAQAQRTLDVVGGISRELKSGLPFGAGRELLRQQAHELLDTLLLTFRDATGEAGATAEANVPILRSASPTRAGSVASISLTVANEEPTPSEASLYCTNLLADSGYEISSLCISSVPRFASIPSQGRVEFKVRVAVPAQAAPGLYSGLLQVTGSTYVKAVLSIQVL